MCTDEYTLLQKQKGLLYQEEMGPGDECNSKFLSDIATKEEYVRW